MTDLRSDWVGWVLLAANVACAVASFVVAVAGDPWLLLITAACLMTAYMLTCELRGA